MKDYVHLLRQRRQHKKLEIIQEALTDLIDAEPNPSRIDIKASLKEALGEPPQPPIAAIDQNVAQSRVDELTFRLKKELLTAKSRLEEAKIAREQAQNRAATLSPPPLELQVAALRRARDYMIEWVEGELAKIPENEGDTSLVDLSFVDNEETKSEEVPDEETKAKVQELYSVYITARERLIANVDATFKSLNHPSPENHLNQTQTTNLAKGSTASKPIRATDILPYLRTLLQVSRDEASLLQQTSHLRRQLTIASEETDRTVQRLAGESYLVPQDTVRMDTWAKAADEEASKTNAVVTTHAEAGEESVEKAKEVLERLERKTKALETLNGGL